MASFVPRRRRTVGGCFKLRRRCHRTSLSARSLPASCQINSCIDMYVGNGSRTCRHSVMRTKELAQRRAPEALESLENLFVSGR